MTLVLDQPPPIARDDRRPAWDLVIDHVEGRREAMTTPVLDLVIADMRARDAVGRERYGMALTSGNGRNHLVDAYAEALDLAVYLAADLDEHGVGLDEPIAVSISRPSSWRLVQVQSMLWDHVRTIVKLRALIEDRAS